MKRPCCSFIQSFIFIGQHKDNFLNYSTGCCDASPNFLCTVSSVNQALCLNAALLIAEEFSPGEVICKEGNRLPGFHLKSDYLTLVSLNSGGLAELLPFNLPVHTNMKLLVHILHLLMNVLFSILPAGEDVDLTPS